MENKLTFDWCEYCSKYSDRAGMFQEVGSVGQSKQIMDDKGNLIGMDSVKLYQCSECKTVKLF